MIDYKITAFDLKLACLEQYRFTKQYVTVDECNNCDIIADSGKDIIEIEIKISKQDLLNGEKAKLSKHSSYKNATTRVRWNIPNKYYFCVPNLLVEPAIKYANKLNPSYGVIQFDDEAFIKSLPNRKRCQHDEYLKVVKKAKALHSSYSNKYSMVISKRCSTKLITLLQKEFRSKI